MKINNIHSKTKNFILLSILCISTLATYAQPNHHCEMKPLSLFGKDTLTFLIRNFGEGESNTYDYNKSLKMFMEDINKQIPIKSFRMVKCLNDDCIGAIDFYYYTVKEIKTKYKNKIKIPAIQYQIYLLDQGQPLYDEIEKMGIDMTGELMPWDNKYLEVLNKLKTYYFILNEYYE